MSSTLNPRFEAAIQGDSPKLFSSLTDALNYINGTEREIMKPGQRPVRPWLADKGNGERFIFLIINGEPTDSCQHDPAVQREVEAWRFIDSVEQEILERIQRQELQLASDVYSLPEPQFKAFKRLADRCLISPAFASQASDDAGSEVSQRPTSG